MDNFNQNKHHIQPTLSINAAKANDIFEHFVTAATLKTILGNYRNLCDLLYLKPNVFPVFYPKLKSNLNSWKAKALWKKFDARASHKCYARGKTCSFTRVLIIGAGPCGLRTAIEAQLLGAKVVVIEKRDRFSRNNVLHLWPFVIDDLRALGAKKFFGKFCAGAIDHISIRQLQCILLKVALLLGVEVHIDVGFEQLVEPNTTDKIGWRAEFKPSDHPVSQYEFDVVVGADGKRNTLQGFIRKEFRGKLAIAITANFINKHTEAEARVEEISGVAFIFNQKFFKELNAETGIDLENIVYYKDDTHYFVMTAKKHSLIDKGVIKQDYSDTVRLLSQDNVDRDALLNYAREAADFSTNYQMPDLEFAVNHYGRPDVAMFDFTSMFASETASKVMERHGYKLLMVLVGDSLLEPFWPTGSGCARGFLSSLDACWAIKAWGSGLSTPLEVIAERESIYRLLAQTTPENLNKDCKSYTVDPSTRYPNLNKATLIPQQVLNQYDTDNPSGIELTPRINNKSTFITESHRKRRRRDLHLDPNILLSWLKDQIKEHEDLDVEDITTSFKDGRVLCAILHHYRPDLLDYSLIKAEEVVKNNQMAFDLLEKELGITPFTTGEEIAKTEVPDYVSMFSYLTQIFDTFRGEIPHIKHPKLETPEPKEPVKDKLKLSCPINLRSYDSASVLQSTRSTGKSKHPPEILNSTKPTTVYERKSKKRKSYDKSDKSVDHENRFGQVRVGGTQEEVAARIKNLEDKWLDQFPVEKRPKDLNRAIGKIETSDWNIKEIAKKIKENKLGKPINKEKERVPKWNKDQFVARQTKMEKQQYDRQNSAEVKYTELDKSIKKLDQRLKEGSVRDLGTSKVAAITEKLIPKSDDPDIKPVLKPNFKPPVSLLSQTNFECCHFCQKRVYLMERLCAERKFFHRGCFKCQYCHASLRLGSYMFDRDGQYGNRFYCSQHYGLPGEILTRKIDNKILSDTINREHAKPLEKLIISTPGIESVDLLDRVKTPERVEFANLSAGHISSDHEESISQMDEDEWTDRNFGASTAEVHTSDEENDSSSLSGSESDNEDAFEEAVEQPPTKEGTLKWMERYKQRYSKNRKHEDDSYSDDYTSSSDHYYENTSGDEDDDPVTESEEEIRARELRKQEVKLQPPVIQTDTGSDTEIISDESTSESSSSKQNSATEISTDSEFAVDDPTPTREIPSIILNDFYVTKSRGQYITPKKVQVKSGILQSPINGKTQKCDIELEFTPLVSSPVLPKPALNSLPVRNEGYALNRTQSTGGIATKVSLELKKKYLLGDDGNSRNIQKSGSVATLDSVFKSFHSNISDCQKLLKPASELSPSKQLYPDKVNNIALSPLSPIISQDTPLKSPERLSCIEQNSGSIPSNATNMPAFTRNAPELTNTTASSINLDNTKSPSDIQNECNTSVFEKMAAGNLNNKNKDNDMSSDSLTLDSDSDQHHTGIEKAPIEKLFNIIPRVEIHNDAGEILNNSGNEIFLDSLCVVPKLAANSNEKILSTEAPKSITSEKKCLNEPKTLPGLSKECHLIKSFTEEVPTIFDTRESTPSDHDSCIEHTEMSDWARDSEDFNDVEFELNPELINLNKNKKHKGIRQVKPGDTLKKTQTGDFSVLNHVCGKERQLKDCINKFSDIMGSIEFMDTGEETSSDEKILEEAALKNNGYVEFLNDDEIALDSLNPYINVIETVNQKLQEKVILENLSTYEKNTGYCVLENDAFDGDNTSLKVEKAQNLNKNMSYNNEEDGNPLHLNNTHMTEENTCSDSTVRNLIKNKILKNNHTHNIIVENDNFTNKYEHNSQEQLLKREFIELSDPISVQIGKIEIVTTPDLINKELLNIIPNSPPRTPKNIYTKEEIKKVRDENQRLVQEMVMNKMKAENKSLERKKHIRNSYSPSRPFDLCKSVTMDMGQISNNKEITVYATPDILLTSNCENNKINKKVQNRASDLNNAARVSVSKHRPLSLTRHHSSFHIKPDFKLPTTITNSEALSLPDIQQALNKGDIGFSKEISKKGLQASLDKVSHNKLIGTKSFIEKPQRNYARGKENENINIHIQDSIEALVLNTERRNSLLYCNDTLTKKRVKRGELGNIELPKKLSVLQPVRTKSVTEISKPYIENKLTEMDVKIAEQLCKSDPNLLTKDYVKTEKKAKYKDRERRKSITKLITDFFGKKKDIVKNGSSSKGFLSRISPKLKSKDENPERRTLARSFSGGALPPNWRVDNNASPPPIPPLPLHYLNNEPVCYSDDSSEHEHDCKQQHSSSSFLDQGRRGSRSARKAVRQAQLKRHRIAQEIQRKLEETEVKTRDLESRGVLVEKELRGEINNPTSYKEETELLKEWFDLMHDLTELRRYERELIVRAQELELEDRHARLQQELRERLHNEEHKTKEDVKTERSIINEMLEIVAKRDCLITLLEQDRIRYSEEDRDFEEQMVAKGLTPLQKTPNK